MCSMKYPCITMLTLDLFSIPVGAVSFHVVCGGVHQSTEGVASYPIVGISSKVPAVLFAHSQLSHAR